MVFLKKLIHLTVFYLLLCSVFLQSGLATELLPPLLIRKEKASLLSYSLSDTGYVKKELINQGSSFLNPAFITETIASNMGGQSVDLFHDGSRSALSLRGFGENASSNTLILIDGLPLLSPDTASLNTNFISPEEIKQIEIIPESAAILYGDQAVGGVINIIPKPPSKKESRLSFGYGSFKSKQVSVLSTNLFENRLGYRLNLQHISSDNYRKHNDNKTNHLHACLTYDLQNTALSFSYYKINQHLQLPGALTLQQVRKDRHQASNSISFNNQETDLLQTKLKYFFNPSWQIKNNLFFQHMKGKGRLNTRFSPLFFRESRQVHQFQTKIKGNISLFNYSFSSLFGGELNKGEYTLNASQSHVISKAVYTQLSFPILKTLTFITGIRKAWAYYNLETTKMNPQASSHPSNSATVSSLKLLWKLHPKIQTFFHLSEIYRFPKVDEQTWTDNHTPLKTQHGLSYETGMIFSQSFFKTFIQIYQLQLKNEIISIPLSASNYFVYNKNLDSTQRTGIILDALVFLSPKVQMDFSYHYVAARFTEGPYLNKRLPFVAQNTFRFSAQYSPIQHWKLLTEGIFTGRRYPINDVENRTHPLGGGCLYNIGISYENPSYSIRLRINNLTNKKYYSYAVATYSHYNSHPLEKTGNHDKQTSEVFYPAPGINAFLEFAINL